MIHPPDAHGSGSHDAPETIELSPTTLVAGGDALARDPDGRVVFIPGAIPGERVRVSLREVKRDFARADLVEIIEASPDRVEPPCPHVSRGCGGCPWQHIAVDAQRSLRRDIIIDALRRIARIEDPPVQPAVELPADAYRTSVRLLSESGTPAYRRSGSHDPVTVDSCLVLHPLLAEMLSNARFEGAKEVEMRAGARTGERMVVAHPRASRLRLPEGVLSVSTAEVRRGKRVCYHEEAAGRRWQISAGSFFQVRPDGADALVALVLRAASEARVVTDLYAGVGLFAGALASEDRRVVAVEANRIAAADARKNLAGLDARIVVSDVARYKAVPADLVVADPSRAGLRADGVAAALSAGPARLVVVSCDAAALARDTVLLAAEGYDLTTVTPVDLFPHTAHVECVSIFDRSTD